MFDELALVLEIISDTEIKGYTLDTKEEIIITATKGDIIGLKEMIETEESVIIPYNRETKIFISDLIIKDEEIEEFKQ